MIPIRSRYHFTKAAANAFASRFFLFKGEYAKAVSYANSVFGASNVISMLSVEYDYLTYSPQEMFTAYQRATEPANLLLKETGSLWGRNYWRPFNSSKRDEIFGPDCLRS